MRNFLFNFMLYIQCASSASVVSLAQQGKKSFTKLHLFLIPPFPNISQYDLTSATFNELKNYNSSSLIPSLLIVFEVKVDYVEGNSRMIIYNNYVEVPQLCMAKKRPFHVIECLLNNAQSRSTST